MKFTCLEDKWHARTESKAPIIKFARARTENTAAL